MVLKAEQDKLRKLLTEAIPLLCKNGIQFKTEFSIEALIGITLDRDQVLLVNINETVRSDFAQPEDEPSESEQQDLQLEASTPDSYSEHRVRHRKRRRRRSHEDMNDEVVGMKHARGSVDDGSEAFDTSQDVDSHNASVLSSSHTKSVSGLKTEMSSMPSDDNNHSRVSIKQEPGEEEDDDLVFVKEDSGDMDLSNMLEQQSNLVSFPNVSHGSQSMGYPNASQQAAGSEADLQSYSEAGTSQQVGPLDSSMSTPVSQWPSSTWRSAKATLPHVPCHICGKLFFRKQTLVDHIRAIHLREPQIKCLYCETWFRWPNQRYRHMKKCSLAPSQSAALAPTTGLDTTDTQGNTLDCETPGHESELP